MSIGKSFLAAILAEKSVTALLQHGAIDHLFRVNEIASYQFVREFVKDHGGLPTQATVEAHTKELLSPATEPSTYYADLMMQRHIELTLKQAMKGAADNLTVDNKKPHAALKALTEAVMLLATQKNQKVITDFRHAGERLLPQYAQHYNGDMEGRLFLGWPTLDGMTNGVTKGDMVSLAGRPAAGKTYLLLHMAMHGWLQEAQDFAKTGQASGQGSRLFVSMEMDNGPIEERLAAMQAKVPVHHVKSAGLGTAGLKRLKQGLTEVKGFPSPFYVINGNLASTVEDIHMYARQLQPSAIFVDGGYLVKHPTERDRYRRVAENSDLIKQSLTPIAPTVVSWQFAKTASKKKKDEAVTGDDVGYTDAIYQGSSVLMGMFEEESVETLVRRLIRILKGRNGEVGQFVVNWNFGTMDFSEVVEENINDLQFL